MKKRLFQIHSWLGLIGALAVVIIGLTGSSLVFYRELDRLMNPSMLVVVPQANTLSLQQLVLKAREAWPEYQLSSVSFDPYNSPDAALTFWLERGEAYAQGHMDPYTGEALGVRDDTLLLWLLRLHSRFLGEDFGETAVFLVGVLLLLSCLTGIFMVRDFARLLTRPRLWGRQCPAPAFRLAQAPRCHCIGVQPADRFHRCADELGRSAKSRER